MKHTPICLLFLLLICQLTQAQIPHTIISNTGLKLRAAPSQTSRVLAVAPFGATVQVLNTLDPNADHVAYNPPARRDTIGEIAPFRYNSQAAPHVGYWWQVRYAGKTGYMFSGFLADSAMLYNWNSEELNNQFRLRATGGNAGATNNPEFDPNWYWYGLFPQPNGTFDLKKVELRYAVQDYTDAEGHYELIHRQIIIQTNLPEHAILILGTRKPWKERAGIEGFWAEQAPEKQYIPGTGEFDRVFMKNYHLEVLKDTVVENHTYPQITLNRFIRGENGRKQRISPLTLYKNYQEPPSALAWAGDLDGDGKLDYVFSAYGEMGYYLLYLSSETKEGELARPVAVLWTWYYC